MVSSEERAVEREAVRHSAETRTQLAFGRARKNPERNMDVEIVAALECLTRAVLAVAEELAVVNGRLGSRGGIPVEVCGESGITVFGP